MPQHEELAPNFKRALLNRIKTGAPFWSLLGMEIVDVRKGWAKVRLPYSEKLSQPLGVAHGGAVFAPADSAVAIALEGLVDRDEMTTTLEMKINYLKPFDRGEITAEARIVHRGRRTALGDVEVRDQEGVLLAKGTATYMILKKP